MKLLCSCKHVCCNLLAPLCEELSALQLCGPVVPEPSREPGTSGSSTKCFRLRPVDRRLGLRRMPHGESPRTRRRPDLDARWPCTGAASWRWPGACGGRQIWTGEAAMTLQLVRRSLTNVKKLAATDATAKNPMQATDATATPTDVLLGFVMRNPTCSHCSQNLQFGN